MKRKATIGLAVAGLLFGVVALAPASKGPAAHIPIAGSLVEEAHAQASKSRGGSAGGAGNVEKVGKNTADLGSEWGKWLTVFITACFIALSLLSRNIGGAVGAVLVGTIALIFFVRPESVIDFASGVGEAIGL